jgi:integrase
MMDVRGHREGSLFQRKSGRDKGVWVAAVTMRDGRRASRTAHSRDQAKLELAELLRLRDAGAPITGRIRLGDFLERWVSDVHRRVGPATARKHRSIVHVHLVPGLGGIRLSELRVADVDRFLGDAADGGLAPQTVRHLRATLRRALRDAVRDGLVARNVGALSRPPGLPHTERNILDATQARILIESTKGTRYGPLWAILVTTGLRISEALGLSWSDIDFGGNDGAAALRPHAGRGSADPASSLRADVRPVSALGPSLTVRRQLARENGEWVHRPTKTAKGRRVVPLTQVGVEALRAQRQMQREDMAKFYGGDDGRASGSDRGESTTGQRDLHRLGTRPRRLGPSDTLADDRDGNVDLQGAGVGDDPGGHAPRAPEADRDVARAGEPSPSVRDGRGRGAGDGRGDAVPDGRPNRMGVPTPLVIPLDGLVFTSERGNPLHGENTGKLLARDLAAAGLPRVTQHQLRHGCATYLIQSGYPIEKVAKILGHSTPRITAEIYMHLSDRDTEGAAEVIERALG